MVGERIDLTVVELNRTDRLVGRKAFETGGAKTAIRTVLLVQREPRRDRGRGDCAIGFLPEACRSFVKRVADVVVRQRRQDHAEWVGLVVKRGRARSEDAFAGRASPKLNDLELLLANAAAGEVVAAAVRARVRLFGGEGNAGDAGYRGHTINSMCPP